MWHSLFGDSVVQHMPGRELLPEAAAFGLASAAWSPLGGGVLTGKYPRGEASRLTAMGRRLFHPEHTPRTSAILDTLEAVVEENDSNAAHVAIAWVVAKGAIPTRAQLDDNLAATSLALSDNQIRRLDEASTAYRDRIAGGKRALLGPPTVPAL